MGRPQKATPEQPRFGIGIPHYVLIQLRALAARKRCSLRSLILTALPAIGIHVEPADMAPDERRSRPKGTRSHYAKQHRVSPQAKPR